MLRFRQLIRTSKPLGVYLWSTVVAGIISLAGILSDWGRPWELSWTCAPHSSQLQIRLISAKGVLLLSETRRESPAGTTVSRTKNGISFEWRPDIHSIDTPLLLDWHTWPTSIGEVDVHIDLIGVGIAGMLISAICFQFSRRRTQVRGFEVGVDSAAPGDESRPMGIPLNYARRRLRLNWLMLMPVWCALVLFVGLKWVQPLYLPENAIWSGAAALAIAGVIAAAWRGNRWGIIGCLITLGLLFAAGLMMPYLID